MNQPLRILLLEDSIDDASLIETYLKREFTSFSIMIVDTKKDYEKALKEFQPRVVISDHTLPQFNSKEALEIYKQYKNNNGFSSVFILVTGTVSEEFAVEVMKNGADDYILKDRLKRLPMAITGAMEKNMLEEKRRKTEEEKLYLLDVLQKSLHEIYIFDPTTLQMEYANEEACKNTGYTYEETVQLSMLDIVKHGDAKPFKKILRHLTPDNTGLVYETYHVRKNKTKYPVQIHLKLIEQLHRKIFLANVLNMTEVKKQQQQNELAQFILATFNKSRTLTESFIIILKEICLQYPHLQAAEIWAKNFEESKIKRFAHHDIDHQPPTQAGNMLTEMALKKNSSVWINFQDEAAFAQEAGLRDKRFVSAMACPILMEKEVLAVIVVFSKKTAPEIDSIFNLDENVRGQLANNIKRKKSEDELSKIFELSPDALVIAGKDGYFKKINPTFSRILGLPVQEILSKKIMELVHPYDRNIIENWQNNIGEEFNYYENRYKTSGGDYVWFGWSITPFFEENLSFAIGKDITEQKKQLQTIKSQNERLAEITWEQSHLVRAPLSRIMGCIQHISESEEKKDELLKSIESSAYELDHIIKQIVNKAEFIKSK